MISGWMTKPFSRVTSMAASMTARVCISAISGYVMDRRHPRWPSIGLVSVQHVDLGDHASGVVSELLGDLGDLSGVMSLVGRISCRRRIDR
jgi:hypothetical protein